MKISDRRPDSPQPTDDGYDTFRAADDQYYDDDRMMPERVGRTSLASTRRESILSNMFDRRRESVSSVDSRDGIFKNLKIRNFTLKIIIENEHQIGRKKFSKLILNLLNLLNSNKIKISKNSKKFNNQTEFEIVTDEEEEEEE